MSVLRDRGKWPSQMTIIFVQSKSWNVGGSPRDEVCPFLIFLNE